MKRLGLCMALWCTQAAAAPADVARLQSLIDSQRYAEAFSLGESLQGEFGLNPDFDFLYGLAALETGRSGRAVLAFERVLMKSPRHHRARLHLARAYLKEGAAQRAYAELRLLLADDPPADIAAQARALLPAQPARTRAFVEAGVGYDSNVNNAVDSDTLITANTLILVDPTAQSRDDSFAHLAFGGQIHKPWGVNKFGFVGLSGYENKNFNESEFDTSSMSLVGGGGFDWGSNRFSIPLGYRQIWVDHSDYLRLSTLGVEWRGQLDETNLLNAAAQYGDYEYEAVNARTAAGYSATFGWSGLYAGESRPRVGGSVFVGEEAVDQAALKYFGRRYYGVTADGSFSPYKDHSPYVSLKLQRSDYDDDDPIYLTPRNEDYSRLAAGWSWQVQPNWRLRAEADYTLNKSNLSLYEFDSNRLFFSTRFDFR